MGQAGRIRVLVLGLIQQDDRILVTRDHDPVKGRDFYRALGGGVEFGETSLVALKREFQEEIGAELTHIQYLGCLENLFTYNGKPGHEIVQVYRCDLVDRRFYQMEQITVQENSGQLTAYWIAIDQFKSGELYLVPEAFHDYL